MADACPLHHPVFIGHVEVLPCNAYRPDAPMSDGCLTAERPGALSPWLALLLFPFVKSIDRNGIVPSSAFTIGVEADGGAARLELDLMDVPGGTTAFHES